MVIVAAQVVDLPEVAEGGGTGSLMEGTLELREGDRGLGSEQWEQRVGPSRASAGACCFSTLYHQHTHPFRGAPMIPDRPSNSKIP